MKWLNHPPKKQIHIEAFEIGPAVDHNLTCWICDKRPAVYSMYPYWMFLPCWKCQDEIKTEGIWNKLRKKWWQFWL